MNEIKQISMNVELIGFLILIVGVFLLIFSAYLGWDWLQYLAVAFLFVGMLMIKYKKIVGGS